MNKPGEVEYTSTMKEQISLWVEEHEVQYMGSSPNRFRDESNWEREMEMRGGQ